MYGDNLRAHDLEDTTMHGVVGVRFIAPKGGHVLVGVINHAPTNHPRQVRCTLCALASHKVLYPPSVPSSSTLRAPCSFASRYKSLPWVAETLMGGSPAVSLAQRLLEVRVARKQRLSEVGVDGRPAGVHGSSSFLCG